MRSLPKAGVEEPEQTIWVIWFEKIKGWILNTK